MVWFKRRHLIIGIILILFINQSMKATEFELSKFENFYNMIEFLSGWFPLNMEIFPDMVVESLDTLAMAFLGSLLGLVLALPLSFMAARNTSRFRFLYGFMRIGLSFLRSVPEIVFGLIFLTALGLGPFPAVLAIVLHNVGVLGKLISELIEAADDGPQDAMKSVGARRWIANLFAILPQIWPNVLSHYFYRFEVAIRTSLILGFIGGGGIGQQLFIHFKIFAYPSVAVDVLLIMIMVVVVDFVGSKIREMVI
ncbi:phosphonate ABC transporter, permease protein PhnE [Alkalihalobacillus sp. AL-G]|uniref:phosphonate ABC transporter, permease protein PhnE n=1 Tax=Alkalihalobacillus sp. AL-G TaxID=2926399 RepID=UPI00272968EB|nr:phosphonate ABC transporter, permease protein PhnE [Alkalihalobacillus sp. AL-G]WLD95267.1 phosphonate ABC transporter, permease protein PhnE [Alkalihalobacillus sp. AL-G]